MELECGSARLHSTYSSEIGRGSTSSDCWHGRSIRWLISPWLRVRAINYLLEELELLAQRVVDGYDEEWDGSNWVGTYTDDAESAKHQIESICEQSGIDVDDLFSVYSWEEWLDGNDIVAILSFVLGGERTECLEITLNILLCKGKYEREAL